MSKTSSDLRVGTVFRFDEHIDTSSANAERVREIMDFRVVYLMEERWVAGIQNLRMPVSFEQGFGPRASMVRRATSPSTLRCPHSS